MLLITCCLKYMSSILRYLYFLKSFTWQTPKSMRKPTFLAALPAPRPLMCGLSWALHASSPSHCTGQSPALPRGAGAALGAWLFSLHRPASWCAVFLGWVISKDPGRIQVFKDCLISCLTRLVLTWASAWETPNTGLCVRSKHSYTRSCSFWGAENNAVPQGKCFQWSFSGCTTSPKGQDWHGLIWHLLFPDWKKKHRRFFLEWPFLPSLRDPCPIQSVSGRKKDENLSKQFSEQADFYLCAFVSDAGSTWIMYGVWHRNSFQLHAAIRVLNRANQMVEEYTEGNF